MEIQKIITHDIVPGSASFAWKRKVPNGKVKITVEEGRLQGYLKVAGGSYQPVILQGLPLDGRKMDVEIVRRLLEESYVKVHKVGIEVMQRGLGGMQNSCVESAVVSPPPENRKIDFEGLLRDIPNEGERNQMRQAVERLVGNKKGDCNLFEAATLSLSRISAKGMHILELAFQYNKTIEHLTILGSLETEGIEALGAILKQSQRLQDLALCEGTIGLEGMKVLGAALKQNETLKVLSLRSCKLTKETMEVLKEVLEENHVLRKLCLPGNDLDDESIKILAVALKGNKALRQLNLDTNFMGVEGIKALGFALKQNEVLEVLSLGWNHIGAEGMRALEEGLAENQVLRELCLCGNQIENRSIESFAVALERHKTLRLLDLSENRIGVSGATRLVGILQELILRKSAIDDQWIGEFVSALNENTVLRRLDLSQNQIGERGLEELARMLTKNACLRELQLDGNDISSVQVLVLALEQNDTLTRLIGSYGVGNQETQAMRRIQEITKSNCVLTSHLRGISILVENFKELHANRLLREEQDVLLLQEEISRTKRFIQEWIRDVTEEQVRDFHRTGLSERYKQKIENLVQDLNQLLLYVFEGKLTLLSQQYYCGESAIDLGFALYEAWISFFGSECPDWLEGNAEKLCSFEHLLHIAEQKAGFNLREERPAAATLFARVCRWKPNIEIT